MFMTIIPYIVRQSKRIW